MRRTKILSLITALILTLLAVAPACALSPDTLANGSRGDEVRKLQNALITLGFLSGSADGVFGRKTEDAVRRFQAANRLTADGLAGTKTLAALYAAGSAPAESEPAAEAPASESSSSAAPSASADLFAGNYKVMKMGSTGNRVKKLQQALVQLNYLSMKPDGKYSALTHEAVLSFQKQTGLYQDGVAGKDTLTALENAVKNNIVSKTGPVTEAAPAESEAPAAESPAAETPASETAATEVPAAETPAGEIPAGSLFGNNYTTLRMGSTGTRVKLLQQALIGLNYLSGSADGKYGAKTQSAVSAFQKDKNLKQDGIAGQKTLTALESAFRNGESAQASSSESSGSSASSSVTSVSAPGAGTVRLLHWFNDIKPTLRNGDHLLIYDPSTGLSWTLQVMSLGRHCDSEPLTKADNDTMYKAFGNKNTWNQKGVYVKLPSGIWTIGSTHDMPHLSGTIKDNGFDGHLCVHFLRDMEEAKANDPNYGVDNQKTIRSLWKSLTGQEITN